jgi:hypothetical protein
MPTLTALRGASRPRFRHRVVRVGVCGALALPRPAHADSPLDPPEGPLAPREVTPSFNPRGLVPSRDLLDALPSLDPLAALPGPDLPNPVSSDPWLAPLRPTALVDAPAPSDTPDTDAPDTRSNSAEPLGSRRGLWLGVSGGFSSSPGERQRLFGLVELGIGLDVWVGARTPALAASSDEPGGDEPDVGPATILPGRSPTPSPPAPFASLSPVRPDSRRREGRAPLRQALAAAASTVPASESTETPALIRSPSRDARSSDPGVLAALARAAVAEARRIGGGASELRRLDGMASRSRAAASLPEMRLGAGTSRDESLRLQPTLTDPGRFTRDGGRDLWLEARLTWRLDSAIFASEEIAIMRLRAQRREEAARLAAEVLEALVDWQRACLSLASEKALPEERDAATVRHFGAVARLDLLTDGWFSRQLERGRPPADSAPWP